MSLTLIQTPGYNFPAGKPITLPALRKAALPSTSISGSTGTSDIADGAITAAKSSPGAYWYATSSFLSDVYSVTLSPALTAYADGVMIHFKATSTSGDTQAQLNVNALGAKKIYNNFNVAIGNGDIRNGQIVTVMYVASLDSAAGGWQIQSQSGTVQTNYVETAGTANAQTATFIPADTSLTKLNGVPRWIKIGSGLTNTGATTLAVNGLAAKAIRKLNDQPLIGGELVAGQIYQITYDSTANSAAGAFLLVDSTVPEVFSGIDTGVADAYVLTVTNPPGAYFAGMKIRFQASNANTTASTINVNGLGAIALKKNVSEALQIGDIKEDAWIEGIYDGTNFQIVSLPLQLAYYSASSASTLSTTGAHAALPHGFGTVPSNVRLVCVCNDAGGDAGFAQNDEVPASVFFMDPDTNNDGIPYVSYVVNATNITILVSTAGTPSASVLSAAGNITTINRALWTPKVYAWR